MGVRSFLNADKRRRLLFLFSPRTAQKIPSVHVMRSGKEIGTVISKMAVWRRLCKCRQNVLRRKSVPIKKHGDENSTPFLTHTAAQQPLIYFCRRRHCSFANVFSSSSTPISSAHLPIGRYCHPLTVPITGENPLARRRGISPLSRIERLSRVHYSGETIVTGKKQTIIAV